jgi:hypothetical protein
VTETRQRQAPRLIIALPVHVVGAGGEVAMTTVDVSRGGLFLHTLDPKPLSHLIRLRIDPGDGREILGHGVVVRVVNAEEADRTGVEPGMGIEFYGFGGDPRHRWEKLLERLASAGVESKRKSLTPLPPQPLRCDAVHKLPRRDRILLLIHAENVEQLYEICDIHLQAPVMTVRTPVQLPPGTAVDLRVSHPLSRDVYDLRGTVERVIDHGPARGLEVALTPGVETRGQSFRDFIESGLPEEELSLEVIEK